MPSCRNRDHCPFYEKHSDVVTSIFPILVSIYCCGPLQDECARKRHQDETGSCPAENLTPTGLHYAEI